jgi:hypothetical protein
LRGNQAFLTDDFFNKAVVFLEEVFFDPLLAFLSAEDFPLTPFFFDFCSVAFTDVEATLLDWF